MVLLLSISASGRNCQGVLEFLAVKATVLCGISWKHQVFCSYCVGQLLTTTRKWNGQGQRFHRSVLCCLLFTMGVSRKSTVICVINHVKKEKTARHSGAYVLHNCSVMCVPLTMSPKQNLQEHGFYLSMCSVLCC